MTSRSRGGGLRLPRAGLPGCRSRTAAALVWLHGGAFMFGTLEMPEADQVGRGSSAARHHRGLGRLHARAPRRPRSARPASDPDADMPVARAVAGRGGGRRPARAIPGGVAADRRGVRLGRRECRDGTAPIPSRVALGGASAGANLSAGAAMRLRDRGTIGAQPARAGVSVAARRHPAAERRVDRDLLRERSRRRGSSRPRARDAINRNYLPDGDDPHGYAFPGGHDLAGFPPVLMVNAELDSLRAVGRGIRG